MYEYNKQKCFGVRKDIWLARLHNALYLAHIWIIGYADNIIV